MKIVIDVLGGDKKAKFTNELMRCADVFEKSKHFVTYQQLTITGNENIDIDNVINNLVNAYMSKSGLDGYVIFAAIYSIDGKRCKEPRPFIYDGVRTLSMYMNGVLGWTTFKDYIKFLGYKPITDETLIVTDVVYPNERIMLNK